MSSGHDPSVVGEQSYRQCLKMGVASLLLELGFDASSPTALETLTEILQSFLVELGRSSRSFTEVACRAEPLPADVLLALSEMGQSTAGIREYAFRVGRRTMPAPGVAQPVKTTSILSTGDRKKHRPGGIIPEHFLEFPDSHSYTRTPTHKQPVTDYESVREKAASQKRDVERALTRFIAKTGKTHSLFNTDDTNLFPLISCDRPMADQANLPPYINALLFKDQPFEEDEREFLAKKKKEEMEEEEMAEMMRQELEDDEDILPMLEERKEKEVKEERDESLDNPFMKPVRPPRTPMKRKH